MKLVHGVAKTLFFFAVFLAINYCIWLKLSRLNFTVTFLVRFTLNQHTVYYGYFLFKTLVKTKGNVSHQFFSLAPRPGFGADHQDLGYL